MVVDRANLSSGLYAEAVRVNGCLAACLLAPKLLCIAGERSFGCWSDRVGSPGCLMPPGAKRNMDRSWSIISCVAVGLEEHQHTAPRSCCCYIDINDMSKWFPAGL